MKKTSILLATTSFFAVAALLITPAFAADRTWDGGGANNSWTNATNWTGDVAPSANDVLIFDGSVRLTPNNNYTALTQFNGINFASGAGAFTNSGNTITLGGNITNASANLQTIGLGGYTLAANVVIDTGSAGVNISAGKITSSTFSVTKIGAATLTLNANQDTMGAGSRFIIGQGSVLMAGNQATPLGTGALEMSNNTSFIYSGTSQTGVGGSFNVVDGATVTLGVTDAGVTNTLPAAALVGTGGFGQGVTIIKTGAGAIKLNSGSTSVAFGSTVANTWRVDGGRLFLQTIDVNSLGNTNNGVVLNGGTLAFNSTIGISAGRVITLSNVAGNGIDVASSSSIISGNITGSGGFTKTGAGTVVLGASNNYTGKTTISAGVLSLSNTGSIASSSEINLGTSGSQGTLLLTNKASFAFGTNQTLSGYGAINIGAGKTVTISGTVAPGNSAGIITNTGNLTLDSTAAIVMELAGSATAGTDFDQLQVSGLLTYGGALTITNYNSYDLTTATNYTLFTAGTRAGSFASVNVAGFGALTFDSVNTYTGTGGGITYTFTLSDGKFDVVPEPSTLALLGLTGIAALGYRLRRRNR